MNQKCRILDRNLYREKYDLAYAYLISEEYQVALSIFLELRQLRFTDFELLESISECYRKLNMNQELQQMIQLMKDKYGNQKSQEIQNIQQKSLGIEINEKELQQYSSFLQNNKGDLNQLGSKELEYLGNTNLFLGNHQLRLEISRLLPKKVEFEQLRVVSTYLNYNYIETIQMVSSSTDQEIQQFRQEIEGMCYYQMKQFHKSLECWQTQLGTQSYNYTMAIQILIINSTQLNYQFVNQLLQFFQFTNLKSSKFGHLLYSYQNQMIYLQRNTQNVQQDLIKLINIGLLLNCHFLFMLDYNSTELKNLKLQQKMIELMIKYNPKLAEGYFDQYLYKQQNNQEINLNQLIEQLAQCYDSVFKFTSLAHLHQECLRIDEALTSLQKAKTLNPYDSAVLKQECLKLNSINLGSIYLKMKNYLKAKEVEKQMIILEQENSHFVLSQVTPYIQQYKFHEALELLNLIEGNEIILVHKVLLQLLNYRHLHNEMQLSIVRKAQNMSRLHSLLFQGKSYAIQGHMGVLENKFEQFRDIYSTTQDYLMNLITKLSKISELSEMNELKLFLQNMNAQIFRSLELTNQQFEQMPYNDRLEQILRISAYQYCQINDNRKNSQIRFKESLLSLLTSLIYYHDYDYDRICQWINSNYSFTLPAIPDLFKHVQVFLHKLYIVDNRTEAEHQKSLLRELAKFRSQFPSFQQCFKELQQFLECQEFENQMNSILNDQLIEILDNQGVQLFQEPYFYDPYSKIALNFIIKVLGFYVGFEDFASGYYDNHTSLWRYLLTSGLSEGYYQAVMKFHYNKQK